MTRNRKIKNGRTYVSLEIPCHRCILANFNAYFERMFSHQLKENLDGKIYIGDKQQSDNTDNQNSNSNDGDSNCDYVDNVDPYAMNVLLEYIYTEQIENGIDRYLLLLLAD